MDWEHESSLRTLRAEGISLASRTERKYFFSHSIFLSGLHFCHGSVSNLRLFFLLHRFPNSVPTLSGHWLRIKGYSRDKDPRWGNEIETSCVDKKGPLGKKTVRSSDADSLCIFVMSKCKVKYWTWTWQGQRGFFFHLLLDPLTFRIW